jgi:hypothetical protein
MSTEMPRAWAVRHVVCRCATCLRARVSDDRHAAPLERVDVLVCGDSPSSEQHLNIVTCCVQRKSTLTLKFHMLDSGIL